VVLAVGLQLWAAVAVLPSVGMEHWKAYATGRRPTSNQTSGRKQGKGLNMSRYFLAGYRIRIEENLKDISTFGEDTAIEIRPKHIEMDRICRDQEDLKKAIDDYCKLEGVER
jgi:hypothetical protein